VRILVSVGEASGDFYAARVVEILKSRHPDAAFFGCAGPRMQAAGVRPVVDQRSLAVVGVVEVLTHIPRIWLEFRKLVRVAATERPDLAILTDSPDFHLRVARKLKRLGIPVVYLIAPQAWAWREGRVRGMRETIRRLLCIFPFEERFFVDRGVPASYIGHPLARLVKPMLTRGELLAKLELPADSRLLAVLPGSRHGEASRHLPVLLEASKRIRERHPVTPVLALPAGFDTTIWEPNLTASIKKVEGRRIEGHTWDVLAQAELALAASGTVTIEAALLGTPMVTFYRVNALSWYLARWMVKSPYLSMVNLVAERRVVPELIQQDMTAGKLAAEAIRLLEDGAARETMRQDLAEVARRLASERDPMEVAADWVEAVYREGLK
jgi:lipid-A-disaccharide synthase